MPLKKGVQTILKETGAKPKKYAGQCFLISGSAVKKIIAAANLRPGETVLEIGPGTGVLTKALLEAGARVIAVEKDPKLVDALKSRIFENWEIENSFLPEADPPLAEKIENCKLKIIVKDILRFDETEIKQSYKIVANIPYYITGKIIQKFLFSKNPPQEMVLMVQKEVGGRIVAKPPRANYLSSLVQSFAEAKILLKVKKECFWPKPKVDSVVIRLIPKHRVFPGYDARRVRRGSLYPLKQRHLLQPQHSVLNSDFINFLRVAFKQPRQTLWNNLRRSKTIPADKLEAVFEKLGLDKNIRGQNLNQQQLAELFSHLHNS